MPLRLGEEVQEVPRRECVERNNEVGKYGAGEQQSARDVTRYSTNRIQEEAQFKTTEKRTYATGNARTTADASATADTGREIFGGGGQW